MNNLLVVLVALSITSLIHNAFEIWGMRQKVHWLRASMLKKNHGTWPINIDSKFKTIALHAFIFLVVTGFMYLGLKYSGIKDGTLAVLGIAVLTMGYAYTTLKVDKFHAEIGNLISMAKRRRKTVKRSKQL